VRTGILQLIGIRKTKSREVRHGFWIAVSVKSIISLVKMLVLLGKTASLPQGNALILRMER
jgi:hypothetical protein